MEQISSLHGLGTQSDAKGCLAESFSEIPVDLVPLRYCTTRTSTDMGISDLVRGTIPNLRGDFMCRAARPLLLSPCWSKGNRNSMKSRFQDVVR